MYIFFDVLNFEINFRFFCQAVFLHARKQSGQKCKYRKNERNFEDEIKSIFHHFQKTLSFQKFSKTLECIFKDMHIF